MKSTLAFANTTTVLFGGPAPIHASLCGSIDCFGISSFLFFVILFVLSCALVPLLWSLTSLFADLFLYLIYLFLYSFVSLPLCLFLPMDNVSEQIAPPPPPAPVVQSPRSSASPVIPMRTPPTPPTTPPRYQKESPRSHRGCPRSESTDF